MTPVSRRSSSPGRSVLVTSRRISRYDQNSHRSPPAPLTGPLVHLIQPNIGQEAKYDDPAVARRKLSRAQSRTALGPAAASTVDRHLVGVGRPRPRRRGAGLARPSRVDPVARRPAAVRRRGADPQLRRHPGSGDQQPVRPRQPPAPSTAVTTSRTSYPLGEYVPARPLMTRLGLARLAPGGLDFLPGPGTADARPARLPRGRHPDLLRGHLPRRGRRRGAPAGVDRQHLQRRVVQRVGTAAAPGAGAAARDRGGPARSRASRRRGSARVIDAHGRIVASIGPHLASTPVAPDAPAAAPDTVRPLRPLDELRVRTPCCSLPPSRLRRRA